MGALKQLYDSLGRPECCEYSQEGVYLAMGGMCKVELPYDEMLRVTPRAGEEVIVTTSTGAPTMIQYHGEDSSAMLNTLAALGLPRSWPTNLGEKVFYLFLGHLKENKFKGPLSLEQQIVPGKESQLELVLRRLLSVRNP
ncbi:hypothetical protein DRJ48_04020 [Candidatus Woesearchaeota archaeon]|nr:hypothetical protein [Candidatus Woesearchaeota archaeon]RLE42200.1 MAG: hypothetical protein DRJ48_04020 [Candidatus Woesearchaeota archaeon]